MKRFSIVITVTTILFGFAGAPLAEEEKPDDGAPAFTIAAKIMIRSPEPMKLAEFYDALGFKRYRLTMTGVAYHFEGDTGALEVVKMDPAATPSGPKTSRTQQGVLAIIETEGLDELVERAHAAGSPLVERWDRPDSDVSIYYIADPENNILGYTKRHHDPRLTTP